MWDTMKLPNYDEEVRLLTRLNFLKPRLICEDIMSLIEYQEITLRKMRKIKLSEFQSIICNNIKIVMENLKQELGHNFIYLVKKCVFLHIFLHQTAIQKKLGSKISEIIEKYLREVVDKDISTVINAVPIPKSQKKREGSLSKIYNAVRSLSKSKQELNREKSNLKFQNYHDKSALKEIIQKIISPWVLYLLKLIQDPLTYSKTLSRSYSCDEWVSLKWKLYNLLHTLGSITFELNRFGKYFKEDLLGSWVFINYSLSTDISHYYNVVTLDLSSRCEKWKEKIIMVQKLAKINKGYKEQLRSISKNEALIEIKRQAENLIEVKEKIIYLYYNTITTNWDYLMMRPFKGGEKECVMEPIEFILDYYEYQIGKDTKAQKLVSKIKRSSSNTTLLLQNAQKTETVPKEKPVKSLKKIVVMSENNSSFTEKSHPKQISTVSTNRNIDQQPTRRNNHISSIKQRIVKQ